MRAGEDHQVEPLQADEAEPELAELLSPRGSEPVPAGEPDRDEAPAEPVTTQGLESVDTTAEPEERVESEVAMGLAAAQAVWALGRANDLTGPDATNEVEPESVEDSTRAEIAGEGGPAETENSVAGEPELAPESNFQPSDESLEGVAETADEGSFEQSVDLTGSEPALEPAEVMPEVADDAAPEPDAQVEPGTDLAEPEPPGEVKSTSVDQEQPESESEPSAHIEPDMDQAEPELRGGPGRARAALEPAEVMPEAADDAAPEPAAHIEPDTDQAEPEPRGGPGRARACAGARRSHA